MLQFARRIKDTVRPTSVHPNRILGFSIGPITMDEGENDVRSVIRDAFDVALATDMAVALHLDDYMMWAQARLPDGRLLRTVQGSAEWSDWSRTPAGRLQIGWLANAQLAPQLCYENPEVKDFTVHWTRDVIGREVRQQFDRLVQAGKEKLFAGVIIGWESNLAQGYCSLSYLGYSGRNPPADFDRERERILQRHIERWAKGIYDAGVPERADFHPYRTYTKTRLRTNDRDDASFAHSGNSTIDGVPCVLDCVQRLLESRFQRIPGPRQLRGHLSIAATLRRQKLGIG